MSKPRKHRLTKAQRDMLVWTKTVSTAHSRPIRHKCHDGSMAKWEATTTVLLREGYLKASKPDKWGMRSLSLTKRGLESAVALSTGNR